MKNKILLIIAIAGFAVIAIFLVLTFLVRRQSPTQDKQQAPVKPTKSTTTPNIPQKELKILNVAPPEDLSNERLPIASVEFTFNDIVNPKTLFYKVEPDVKTYVKTAGNTFTLYPEVIWKPGTTIITVLGTTKSVNNYQLTKPFIYKLNTKVPEDPPDDFEI